LTYIIDLAILVAVALSRHSAADLAAQQWTDVTTYARHYADDPVSLTVGLVVQVSALLARILILVAFLVLHRPADPALWIMTRIASTSAMMMAVMSSWGYCVQLASVHKESLMAVIWRDLANSQRRMSRLQGWRPSNAV
jgi:hypothetical protein